MRGEVLFEKMTGISDEFIAEAALVAPAGVAAPGKKPFASLSRALHSGWGVACLFLVLAVASLLAMGAWGRITNPAPAGNPPLARFGFTYTIHNHSETEWDGTVAPGDRLLIQTTVINRGLPFLRKGPYTGYCASARLVLQDQSYMLFGGEMEHTADDGTYTVGMGEEGRGVAEFRIPKDAVPGVYDLVLSYGGTTTVFKGIVTVVAPTEDGFPTDTYPPLGEDHPFSFGYEPMDNPIVTNLSCSLKVWVTNEGEPFSYFGSTAGFIPSATLVHRTTGYSVLGIRTFLNDYRQIVVQAQETGYASPIFLLTTDAPAGDYDLMLSYGGQEQRFENVLTVRITDSTEPLSNEQLIQAAKNLLSLLTPDEADAYHYVSIADSCVVTESTATVSFFLHLGDVRTEQYIKIELSTEGVYRSHTVKSPEYAAFLPLVTNEMVEAAKKELFDKVNGSGQYEELFFTLNSDLELILYYEDFVYSESLGSIAPRNYSVTVCDAPSFSLTAELPEGVALTQSLSETYRMCDTVSLQLSGKDHVGYVGYINGKPALIPRGTRFEFSMPAEDTVITVKEFPVKTAYGMDAEMIATYMVDNGVSTAEILHFYDSRRGYAAVMMNSADISYQKEPWHEFIHNAEFRYADSNRVLIYYARQFYTLQEAVNEGLLDSDSAIILVRKHKELFPENYARS